LLFFLDIYTIRFLFSELLRFVDIITYIFFIDLIEFLIDLSLIVYSVFKLV